MRGFETQRVPTPSEMVHNIVSGYVRHHPFLRNFDTAIHEKKRRKKKAVERMILDILRPHSQVSFLLYIGLPGTGKTTLADAVADAVEGASLRMVEVQRWYFSDYRTRAIEQLHSQGKEPTKEAETELATQMMTRDALRIIDEGPYNAQRRRVVIAEMPVYPVDHRQRGLDLVRAIGEKERGVPYRERRARVNGIKPDLAVIKNGIVTRLLKMSSGGSPEMLMEIAYKAYGGALLFRLLEPKLFVMLNRLVKDTHGFQVWRRNSPEEQAAKVITLRMLAILRNAGLYGPLSTILMNPARMGLERLSRVTPQKHVVEQ